MGGLSVLLHFLGVPEALGAVPDLARVQRLLPNRVPVLELFCLREQYYKTNLVFDLL